MRAPRAARAGLAVLVLLALLVPTASAAPFDAELRPTKPVRGTGSLATNGDFRHVMLWNGQAEAKADPAPFLLAEQSRIIIQETRSFNLFELEPEPPKEGPAKVGDPLADRVVRREFISNHTRLILDQPAPSMAWSFVAGPRENDTADFRVDGGCEFVAKNESLPLAPSRRSPLRNAPSYAPISARCSTQLVSGEGFFAAFFFAGRFRLIDDERDEFVPTGDNQATPINGGPAAEYIRRSLHVVVVKAPASFQIRRPANLTLESPQMAWAGSLVVPASSEGNLSWGAFHPNGSSPSVEPSGAFSLFGAGARWLRVWGESVNEPPSQGIPIVPVPDGPSPAIYVAAAAAASFLLVFARPVRLFLLGLFTRITQSGALDHPSRRSIMEFVRTNPGVGVQELSRFLGVDFRTASHHARILCQQSLLVCRQFSGQTALFVRAEVPWNDQEITYRLRSPRVREAVVSLWREPGLSQAALAGRVGTTQQNVSRIVRDLVGLGVLTSHREGRKTRYRVAADRASWLAQHVSGQGSST